MNSTLVKSLILAAMGLFLLSRYLNNTLLYYINERFVWLIIFGGVGLLVVAAGYFLQPMEPDHVHDESCDHAHDHEHHHDHSNLTWLGLAIILSPIVLGVLITPRPLGAAAMDNREVGIESLTSVSAPSDGAVIGREGGEKNIYDWLVDFRTEQDWAVFQGEEVNVVGFVYRDERFAENEFLVARFIVSCCAADASPIGLVVRSDQAADLADDQWVVVKGNFTVDSFDSEEMPILMADEISLTDVPNQPYLYPW